MTHPVKYLWFHNTNKYATALVIRLQTISPTYTLISSMNHRPRKTLLVNTFGMFGYLFCLLSWAWTGILYIPILLANKQIEEFLLPSSSESPVAPQASVPMSPVTLFFTFMITVAVIIVTIVILLRAPVTIARTGKTVTTKAAGSMVPLVAHGKPLPAATRRRLTAQLIKLVKLLLVILPVMIASFGAFIELPLSFEIVIFVSATLALIAIAWFSAQYIFARLFGVKPTYLA